MLRQIFYLIIDRNGYIDILIHIKFYPQTPSTTAEWKHIAKEFHNKWNFPNCIGALDGKHVLIQPPKECGSYYYNYKGTNRLLNKFHNRTSNSLYHTYYIGMNSFE